MHWKTLKIAAGTSLPPTFQHRSSPKERPVTTGTVYRNTSSPWPTPRKLSVRASHSPRRRALALRSQPSYLPTFTSTYQLPGLLVLLLGYCQCAGTGAAQPPRRFVEHRHCVPSTARALDVAASELTAVLYRLLAEQPGHRRQVQGGRRHLREGLGRGIQALRRRREDCHHLREGRQAPGGGDRQGLRQDQVEGLVRPRASDSPSQVLTPGTFQVSATPQPCRRVPSSPPTPL